jgi:amino acid transporter
MTTSSRMIYAFARWENRETSVLLVLLVLVLIQRIPHRDGGLPASFFFSRIHPKLQVPLNALYLNLVLVIIFGVILLGSTRCVLLSLHSVLRLKLIHFSYSAFNAIISASVVLLDLSYGIPIAVHCLRGRNMLPERHFVLPNLLGWVLNIVCLNFMEFTFFLVSKMLNTLW